MSIINAIYNLQSDNFNIASNNGLLIEFSGKGFGNNSNSNNNYDGNGIGFQLRNNNSSNKTFAIIDTSNIYNNYGIVELGIAQDYSLINNYDKNTIINNNLFITNDKIGIGSNEPKSNLDLNTNINISNNFIFNNTEISTSIINTKSNLNFKDANVNFNSNVIITSNITIGGTIYKLDGTPYITDTTSSSSLTGSQWQTSINNISNIYFSSGFIGIGTTNPQSILHLHSTNLNNEITIRLTDSSSGSNTTDGFVLQKSSTQNGLLWNYEGFPMIFGNNNNEVLRINSNGRIGIGTTNPSQLGLVDIRGNLILSSNLLTSSGTSVLLSQLSNSANNRNIYYNQGSFGIGITNPKNLMDINGNVIINNGFVGIGTTNPKFHLELLSSNVNTNVSLRVGENLLLQKNSNQDGILFNTINNDLIFGTNNQEQLRIKNDGKIGILTQTPTNEFNINGTIGSTEYLLKNVNISNIIDDKLKTTSNFLRDYTNKTNKGDFSSFLLKTTASSTYLSQSTASSTYLSQTTANSTYGTITNLNNKDSPITFNNPLSNAGASTIYSNVFNYTGTIQTFAIPDGVSSINIYAWGAGGSSGSSINNTHLDITYNNGYGGNGGFVSTTLNTSGISELKILVGQGGRKGIANNPSGKAFGGGSQGVSSFALLSGGGGGLSGVFTSVLMNNTDITSGTAIVISGGGGASAAFDGSATANKHGGNAGGTLGNKGSDTTNAGNGGTQQTGGTVGNGGLSGDGAKFKGGTYGSIGSSSGSIGGSGGGSGWFGGGAGGYNGSIGAGLYPSGGGGSSYLNDTDFILTNKNIPDADPNGTRTAPGATNKYYKTGIALGGDLGVNDGGDGLIVIEYSYNTSAIVVNYNSTDFILSGSNLTVNSTNPNRWISTTGNNIYFNSGSVGIGIANPTATLHLQSSITSTNITTGQLLVNNSNNSDNNNSIITTRVKSFGYNIAGYALENQLNFGWSIFLFDYNNKLLQINNSPLTNSTSYLVIDTLSCNIGIGGQNNKNPVSQLHLINSGDTNIRLSDNSTGSSTTNGLILLRDSSYNGWIHNYFNANLIFGTTNNEIMRLTKDNTIGIGITNPYNSLYLHLDNKNSAGLSSSDYSFTGTGNTESYVANNSSFKYISFINSGTLTLNSSVTCDIFMIGGGGGGGCSHGGGGGAGACYYDTNLTLNSGSYSITIGSGGSGGTSASSDNGTNGGNTSISLGGTTLYIVNGGGRGGTRPSTSGKDGGCGGGGGSYDGSGNTNTSVTAGTASNAGTNGTGNNGGTGCANVNGGVLSGGGGGGIGGTGGNASNSQTGNGGVGGAALNINITGTNVVYGGGGGGGVWGSSYSTTGGLGGGVGTTYVGGQGGTTGPANNQGLDAVANTGSGGGGGGPFDGSGGNGSAGIVIIRFKIDSIKSSIYLTDSNNNINNCEIRKNINNNLEIKTNTNSNIIIETNNSEKLRINSNIGIGKTNPQSLLDISGNLQTSGNVINISGNSILPVITSNNVINNSIFFYDNDNKLNISNFSFTSNNYIAPSGGGTITTQANNFSYLSVTSTSTIILSRPLLVDLYLVGAGGNGGSGAYGGGGGAGEIIYYPNYQLLAGTYSFNIGQSSSIISNRITSITSIANNRLISALGGGNGASYIFTTSGSGTVSPITFIDDGTNDAYLSFTAGSTTLTLNSSINCDILAVGGGGGGCTGGGGAGQVVYQTNQTLNAGNYTITVGAGGAGVAPNSIVTAANRGNDGNDSFIQLGVIDVVRAYKGGGGAGNTQLATAPTGIYGSTGGNGINSGGSENTFTAGTVLGFVGGVSTTGTSYNNAGGGGGAGEKGKVGTQGPNDTTGSGGLGGAGGNGVQNSITGTSIYYGGGGGGGTNINNTTGNTVSTRPAGGLGGGGAGSRLANEGGLDAINNTGGGGGGSDFEATSAGNGGSGIVIIRFKNYISHSSVKAASGGSGGGGLGYKSIDPGFSISGGSINTVSNNNNYKYAYFSTNGTLTVPTNTFCDILVVGGGGGGGRDVYDSTTLSTWGGGAGGAGACIYMTNYLLNADTYTITVGLGGARNTNGAASTIRTSTNKIILNAIGGGRGAQFGANGAGNGGSGGGSINNSVSGYAISTSNVPEMVFGTNGTAWVYSGSGLTFYGGYGGGLSLNLNITGNTVSYAVGGSPLPSDNSTPVAGQTGNGGRGGGSIWGNSTYVGGSGVVIIRYQVNNLPSPLLLNAATASRSTSFNTEYYNKNIASIAVDGNNGTLNQGGSGGGSGLYTSRISGISVLGNSLGATGSSTATNGTNPGQGGSGNGGTGANGLIEMRFSRLPTSNLTFNTSNTNMSNVKCTDIVIVNSNLLISSSGGTPSYPLDIQKTASLNLGSLPFESLLTSTGVIGNQSTTTTVSLKSEQVIWTQASLIASSDSRIKTNITDINDNDALLKLMTIQPKTYNYIDITRKNGNKKVYGFLAQQIKEVLPEAVQLESSIIPNIYSLGEINSNSPNEIFIDTNSNNSLPIIKINDEIRIITPDKDDNYKITEVINSNNFKIDKYLSIPLIYDENNSNYYYYNKCIVYGTKVNDFHTLDKNYIYTLNVCATQDLYKQLSTNQKRLDSIKEKLNLLTSNSHL